jgi:hypothetical protein
MFWEPGVPADSEFDIVWMGGAGDPYPGGAVFGRRRESAWGRSPGDDDLNFRTYVDSPTTKAECRTGGWQTFVAFSSHHDCTVFVRQRARQACIFERVAHGVAAFRTKYGIGPQDQLAMWACVHERTGF